MMTREQKIELLIDLIGQLPQKEQDYVICMIKNTVSLEGGQCHD